MTCNACHGAMGGTPGNENVLTLCDYCHAKILGYDSVHKKLLESKDRAEKAERLRDYYLAQLNTANEQMRRLMEENNESKTWPFSGGG